MAFDLVDGHDLYDIEPGEYDMIILAGKSGVRQHGRPAGYWRNNVEVTKSYLNYLIHVC